MAPSVEFAGPFWLGFAQETNGIAKGNWLIPQDRSHRISSYSYSAKRYSVRRGGRYSYSMAVERRRCRSASRKTLSRKTPQFRALRPFFNPQILREIQIMNGWRIYVACCLVLQCSLAVSTQAQQSESAHGLGFQKRHGDEIMVCGQLYRIGTPVKLWLDPGGFDAYRTTRHFSPFEKREWKSTVEGLIDSPIASFDRGGRRC